MLVAIALATTISATVGFDHAADRRHDRRRRSRENLAHDLDRRLDRRARRAAADPRLGACVADHAPCGSGHCRIRGGRWRRWRWSTAVIGLSALVPVEPAPDLLSGVSGADLGRGALRPARGDARGVLRGGHGGVAHREQRRAVRAAFDHAERPQHTALHRGRGGDDAVPRCDRERTPALRRGAGRVQAPRDGTRGRGAPAHRARPARLRVTVAVLDDAARAHRRARPEAEGPARV